MKSSAESFDDQSDSQSTDGDDENLVEAKVGLQSKKICQLIHGPERQKTQSETLLKLTYIWHPRLRKIRNDTI